jgi:APA family basic amino acid/polyamine antiporter
MIGTGIFTVPAFVRAAAGSSPAALAVWMTGAVLALCGTLTYAELATRMPQAGGEYHFLARVYGPMWGFLSGWVSFVVGFSAAAAASSLAAVAYAAELLPFWAPEQPLLGGPISQGAVVAAMLILALAVYHCAGVRGSGLLQSCLAFLGLGAVVLLVVFGFASGRGDWHGVIASSRQSGSWWVALIQVTFAYSGWNAAAYVAGEVKNPARNLPRALLGGTILVALAYLALNVLFFYALPEPQWQSEIAVGFFAAERLFGAAGARAVTALIALAIFGSVSAMMAAGPRVYYAMARDGLGLPGFDRLGKRSQAPVLAIMAQAVVAAILALTGAFGALLTYIGSSLLLFTGLAVGSIYLVRRRRGDEMGKSLAFRVPGYPVTPAVYVVLVLAALVNGFIDQPVPTGAAFITVGVGGLVYGEARRRGWLSPDWQDR